MKYLHFGPGAGLYIYYTGIAQALYETVDHDVLRTYKIGGTSAGLCAAMALYFSLYIDDMTPDRFYREYVKYMIDIAKSKPTGFYFVGADIAYDMAIKVYRELYDKISVRNRKLYSTVSKFPQFSIYKHDLFESEHEYATYMSASMSIPILVNLWGYKELNGQKLIDGFFTPYYNQICDDCELDSMVYLSCLPFENSEKNMKYVDVFAWVDHNLRYLLSPTNVNHDALYQKGYLNALKRKRKLIKLFHSQTPASPPACS